MLPPDTRLFSVDDHVIEPPTVWIDRLPARFHDVCPRVVRLADGTDAWRYEDMTVQIERGVTRTLPEIDDVRSLYTAFDQMRPGCYDPAARLLDMDVDGVSTQLAFPHFPRFAGHRFLAARDKELALRCVEAYNDFVIGEWSATSPDRLAALAILPLWDPALAATEVRRVASSGARAVAFSENPTVLRMPSIHTGWWDPVWAAVEETGLPICMHVGSSSRHFTTSADAPGAVLLTNIGVNAMLTCADWIFSGVFDRFPGLRIVLSEGGAGWVPYVIERADRVWAHGQAYIEGDGRAEQVAARIPRLPSEVFAQHVYACMISEVFAPHALDWIPVDNLLWESDYPHNDSLWPTSRACLEEALCDVADSDARKIGELNARRLFRMSDQVLD
jgi:predicted TIM-barrel fold metal-dependent hydrolase